MSDLILYTTDDGRSQIILRACKKREAQEADLQDEADLKALKAKLKRRPKK